MTYFTISISTKKFNLIQGLRIEQQLLHYNLLSCNATEFRKYISNFLINDKVSTLPTNLQLEKQNISENNLNKTVPLYE